MSYRRYQPHRSRYPKYVVGATALALTLVGIGCVVWSLSGNRGTIEQPPVSKAAVHGPALLTYDGNNITFQYRNTYQVVRQTPSGTSLEMSMLNADTSYEKRLAVAVFPLDPASLDTFSPYAIRKVQPNLYVRTDVPIAGGTATVFTKNDGSEITAIVPHGGKVATLSFTTGSSYDNLPAEVSALLQTFRWKQ